MPVNLPATDWCAKWATYSPQKTAFHEHETGRSITYGNLNRAADALAWQMTVFWDLKKGDRVAVLADFCLEYMVLFAAAQKTGCILVPLNFRLASPELDYMLKNAAPRVVIAESKFQALLDGTTRYKKTMHRFPLTIVTEIMALKEIAAPFPAVKLRENDPVFILYTSGTTGFPKGSLYTHKMLFWNSINTAISLVVNTESRTLLFAPPFHTGGWNVLTTPFIHHGGYTCLLKKFDPTAVLALLQTERCTLFFGVPTMLKMIADEPGFAAATFPDLQYVIVGGEPMPLPLIEIWSKKGVPVRQGYGMTEVGPNLTSLHQDDALNKRGSIGRPNFYVETCIVDEQAEHCPPNQPGELWLRGPMVTPGYWRNPAATQKAFAAGDWFRTGDLVREDEDGYLYVVDRIKNMFISGGENVYPAELERILLSHPAVAEAAVIGVPDEKWGEVGRAFIVKKADATIEASALLDYCKDQLAKYKVPRSVVFMDGLPRNDAGKINRMALKDEV
jgi:fatty-acyl-CoA synthase